MSDQSTPFPTHAQLASVNYAPEGEFVKDHSFVYHDGLWHLFSISGPLGRGWTCEPGGEETFSHSVSEDIIHWRMVGHVLKLGKPGDIDAHKIWAPHVISHEGTFYMFYSGVARRNPDRTDIESIWEDLSVSLCLATSRDLVHWEKHSATEPICAGWGQDPHVLNDEERGRFYLYSTGKDAVIVRESEDLLDWTRPRTCLRCSPQDVPWATAYPVEAPFVLKHEGVYFLLLHDGYATSRDPVEGWSEVRPYRGRMPGFAGEVIPIADRYIRTGVAGNRDHYRLRMQEIAFEDDGVNCMHP